MRAASRVERAARIATKVHRAREPAGDDRTQAKNADQHRQIQQQLFQRRYFSSALL